MAKRNSEPFGADAPIHDHPRSICLSIAPSSSSWSEHTRALVRWKFKGKQASVVALPSLSRDGFTSDKKMWPRSVRWFAVSVCRWQYAELCRCVVRADPRAYMWWEWWTVLENLFAITATMMRRIFSMYINAEHRYRHRPYVLTLTVAQSRPDCRLELLVM